MGPGKETGGYLVRIKFSGIVEGTFEQYNDILKCIETKYGTKPCNVTIEIDDTVGSLPQPIQLISIEEID